MAAFETITKVLAVVSAAYPNFDLKPETVKVYLKLLADLPDELLEEASLAHIAQSTYFPTVAELRSAAVELLERQDPFRPDWRPGVRLKIKSAWWVTPDSQFSSTQ